MEVAVFFETDLNTSLDFKRKTCVNCQYFYFPRSCPTFDTLRRQTWPSPVDAHRKLWGPVEILRQTADFALLTGLKI